MVSWQDAITEVQPKHKVPNHIQVIAGGISGALVATLLHPLDLIKVRLQVHAMYMPTQVMAKKIIRCEGVSALFNGWTAGILRQATFTTTKLAVYNALYEKHQNKYGIVPGLKNKVAIGLFAGVVGAVAGNPADLVLIRMMADTRRDPCSPEAHGTRPPRYKGALHAVYKIWTTEGFFALWRGGTLTLTRSAFATASQITGYTVTRRYLKKHYNLSKRERRARLHVFSSFITGFLTAVLTLPLDVVKTKFQIRTDEVSQRHIFLRKLRTRGVWYFWRGFIPYYLRISYQTTFTYLMLIKISEEYATILEYPIKRD